MRRATPTILAAAVILALIYLTAGNDGGADRQFDEPAKAQPTAAAPARPQTETDDAIRLPEPAPLTPATLEGMSGRSDLPATQESDAAMDAILEVIRSIEVSSVSYDPQWMSWSFAERARRFRTEARDFAWAAAMERAIAEQVAAWTAPPVQLLEAQCHATICRIATFWPPNTRRQDIGQQISRLWGLGLDHQGETEGSDEANGHVQIVFARRR